MGKAIPKFKKTKIKEDIEQFMLKNCRYSDIVHSTAQKHEISIRTVKRYIEEVSQVWVKRYTEGSKERRVKYLSILEDQLNKAVDNEDQSTALKYIQELNKLEGNYPAERTEVNLTAKQLNLTKIMEE